MGRSVDQLMKEIYDRIDEYISDENKHRCCRPTHGLFLEDELYDMVEKVKYQSVNRSTPDTASFIQIDCQSYLFSSSEYELYHPGIVDVSDGVIRSAIALVAVAKGDLRIKKELSDIRIIDVAYTADDTVSCRDVLSLFNDYSIYRIEESFECSFVEDLRRISCLTRSYGLINEIENDPVGMLGHLSLEYETIKLLIDFLEVDTNRYVVSLVENILQTESLGLIFLQAYQMLELLYDIDRAVGISNKHGVDFIVAYRIVCDDGRYRREEECLYQLLNKCKDYYETDELYNLLCADMQGDDKVRCVSRRVYKARCEVAHFSLVLLANRSMDDPNVYRINRCVCDLIKIARVLYGEYEKQIREVFYIDKMGQKIDATYQ